MLRDEAGTHENNAKEAQDREREIQKQLSQVKKGHENEKELWRKQQVGVS